jgi:hypothetical protein
MPADGIFAEFLKAYGVPEPPPLVEPKLTPKGRPLDWWSDPEKRPTGRSSLHKWSCGCQNVRVGTAGFHAQCLKCGNVFALVERRVEPNQPAPASVDAKPTSDSGWEQSRFDLTETAVVDVETTGQDIATIAPFSLIAP